jgi:nuclear transport factor 2 (NTF2) superfamily protein
VNGRAAAARWAQTWQRAWPLRDAAAIAALYAPDAAYRSSALAEPEPGGASAYLGRQFPLEQDVRCRFGQPLVDGTRAAVEWWASWIEDGQTVTLAGVTVLHFDGEGRVVDHVDYWLHAEGRRQPYLGWAT